MDLSKNVAVNGSEAGDSICMLPSGLAGQS